MTCPDTDCRSKSAHHTAEYELLHHKRNLSVEAKCFWLSLAGGSYGIMTRNLSIYWIPAISSAYRYFVNSLWKPSYVVILFLTKPLYHKFRFFIASVFVSSAKLKIRSRERGWTDINHCEAPNDPPMFVCGRWRYQAPFGRFQYVYFKAQKNSRSVRLFFQTNYWAVYPPSMTTAWPVTPFALSLAKNTA